MSFCTSDYSSDSTGTPTSTGKVKRALSARTPSRTKRTPVSTCSFTTPTNCKRRSPSSLCAKSSSSCKKTPRIETCSKTPVRSGAKPSVSTGTCDRTPRSETCSKTPVRGATKLSASGGTCGRTPRSESCFKTPVRNGPKPTGLGDSCGRTPRPSIVHSRLELTDPNPDPVELFERFNKDYFQGKLKDVTVKWSSRMTQCAGVCTYKGRKEGCQINLSVPLLALRSRKDLVETLLHEMIHAYLFVVDGDVEREEHGPKFLRHMERINKKTGCNITVEHDFLCEVDYYQAHVWRCTGPCRNLSPDRGMIKRSVNRSPGPRDSWWNEHKRTCKGKFVKVSEPTWKPSSLV